MKQTLIWLKEYGIMLITFFLLINLVQNCNQNKKMSEYNDEIVRNTISIDSIQRNIYSRHEIQLIGDINRLRAAKLTLYDQNAIVRTKIRPDDRMNEYDVEIEALTKELNDLRRNKGY